MVAEELGELDERAHRSPAGAARHLGEITLVVPHRAGDELQCVRLRAQIAMVSQNVVLFDDTVAANIAYGDARPDRRRIEAAAKALGWMWKRMLPM